MSDYELWDLLADVQRRCEFVDLTHAFAPGIPHPPFFPDEQRSFLYDFPSDTFRSEVFTHVGQWGTHADPPSHFTDHGRTLDEIGVEEMLAPLVVLDVTSAVDADPDYCVQLADVAIWEDDHGRIPPRAFVALRTGWSRRWPDAAALRNDGHTPGWSVEVLRLLCEERDIVACGHETADTDSGATGARDGYPCETYVLEQNRYQIEMLAALDRVPSAGALVVASFPKPQGGSGFPARVFAIVPRG